MKKVLFTILGIFLLTLTFCLNGVCQEMETAKPIIVFETNQGDITIELFPNIAPKACENMLGLIEQGYYNGIIFHRVMKGFMIQGGDPDRTGHGGKSLWGIPFKDEVGPAVEFNKKGLLAMANAGPSTNGSQFFITTTDNASWLNGKHTIFGEVIKGYDVVEKIENTTTGMNDLPIEDQIIVKARIQSQ